MGYAAGAPDKVQKRVVSGGPDASLKRKVEPIAYLWSSGVDGLADFLGGTVKRLAAHGRVAICAGFITANTPVADSPAAAI
jgi:hypothetical protein